MTNLPASTSTTDIVPVLRAALKTVPWVSRVTVTCDGSHRYLSVHVDGRRIPTAAVYLTARVVVPLSNGAVSSELNDILNGAVCRAATGQGLTILSGVEVWARTNADLSRLSMYLPGEAALVRERELTAATTSLRQAHAQRLLAETGGTPLPTGVALLTGAPLQRRTLDFPLADAEARERERLQSLVAHAGGLRWRIGLIKDQIKFRTERIALAEEWILETTASNAAMNAELAQLEVELAAQYTPEAVRERLEAAAQLSGEAVPAS